MIQKVDDNIRVKIKSKKSDTDHIHNISLQKKRLFLWIPLWENILGYSLEVQVCKYWGARIEGISYSPICGTYQSGHRYEVWLPEEFDLYDRVNRLIRSYKNNLIQ